MTKGVRRNLDVEASYDYGGRYPKRLLHNMLGICTRVEDKGLKEKAVL